MRIGIDLDEVLADFLTALLKYHNDTYGTSLVGEQFQSYQFWETWGGTRERAIQKVYDFYNTGYFRELKPVVGSQEAVSILKQNNELFVITSRQDDVAEATRGWIAQHFPERFSAVLFANHYSQKGDSRKKSQICDSVGIDVLIEDSPEYALECFTQKRKILLLDYPWNRNSELPPGIYRVNSWEEITKILARDIPNS